MASVQGLFMTKKIRSDAYRLPDCLASIPEERTKVIRANSTDPDSVLFRLIKLSNLMTRPFFSKFAKKFSMNFGEWHVLAILAAKPGIAAHDISAEMGSSPMNVSRAVKKLRDADMVKAARDPHNHRRTLLWLSTRGIKTFNEVSLYAEEACAITLEVLTLEEQQVLRQLANALIERLEITTS
jgi:DNA-binding MarR family transcriptional regulator